MMDRRIYTFIGCLVFFVGNFVHAQPSIQAPQIQDQHPTGFSLVVEHAGATNMGVVIGLTPDLELGEQWSSLKSGNQLHARADGLAPATFYYARPRVVVNSDTLTGALGYYSTQSSSTGEIKVFFNQGIDSSYSTGSVPPIVSGGANIENAIIAQIDRAQQTIDVAVFNTSRRGIVSALTRAHYRGVRVRFLANQGTLTSNSALSPAPPFPVAYVNATDLMHNKFVAIDAHSIDSSWLWTGSCNWTYTDMYTNYNNVVLLQDQALVRAYELEFNEMWGSAGPTFNASASRVGSAKTNNTPAIFNVGGRTVELYFSPSDGTTAAIERNLYTATNDLEFATLVFTRNELGAAIRNEHRAGVWEHGLMENIGDPGSEYNWLRSQGVNVLSDANATALHHKYAIVDAGSPSSDPMVITGSHNWTTAAEERNDENTLIIHDATIANLFLQEFAQRWCEAKGFVNCGLPFSRTVNSIDRLPMLAEGLTLTPNPANQAVVVALAQPPSAPVTIQVYNLIGQLVHQEQANLQDGQTTLSLQNLEIGGYLLQVRSEQHSYREKLLIVR